jgi:membrane-associated phospholipid phosphatase
MYLMFVPSVKRWITGVLILLTVAASLEAQSLPPAPTETAVPESQTAPPKEISLQDRFPSRGFLHQMLADQKTIWTSPAHISKSDVKWLAPLAGVTALALANDQKISTRLNESTSLKSTSIKVSKFGSAPATFGAAGAFLLVGKLTGNERMGETGARGIQALVYSTIVMQTIKMATDRTRPFMGGDGHFWNGGNSFPSGHSMEAWALAKVVSDTYHDKPLVKVGMYSLASAVAFSRVGAQRHYVSDVVVGSAIGYLIGKFVMRHHTN